MLILSFVFVVDCKLESTNWIHKLEGSARIQGEVEKEVSILIKLLEIIKIINKINIIYIYRTFF